MAKDYMDSYSETSFKDYEDPTDEAYRIVELRIPLNPSLRPYQTCEYQGFEAAERIRRFCAGFLAGYKDLTEREAEKIIKKSNARKKKN